MNGKHTFTNEYLNGLEIDWQEGEDYLDIRLNGEAVDRMRLDESTYEHAAKMVNLFFRIMHGDVESDYLH
jgi:hypothetical protein